MRTPSRETPFKLAYGNWFDYRVAHYKDEENEEQLRLSLALLMR